MAQRCKKVPMPKVDSLVPISLRSPTCREAPVARAWLGCMQLIPFDLAKELCYDTTASTDVRRHASAASFNAHPVGPPPASVAVGPPLRPSDPPSKWRSPMSGAMKERFSVCASPPLRSPPNVASCPPSNAAVLPPSVPRSNGAPPAATTASVIAPPQLSPPQVPGPCPRRLGL